MRNKEFLFFLFSFAAAVTLCGICVAKITAARSISIPVGDDSIHLPLKVDAARVMGRNYHVRGSADAPCTIVEFGDYECPPCAQVHDALKTLLTEAPGKARLVFRNFPLTEIHPYAYKAALAAEAAAEQGKFWEMHDLLYDNPARLTAADLEHDATTLHLDLTKFRIALKTEAAAQVATDIAATKWLGLGGTPSLLLCNADGSVRPTNISELQRLLR